MASLGWFIAVTRVNLVAWILPFFWIAASLAQDKAPVELRIQAILPEPSSHMAFGFDALWTMSDGMMLRVNAANNGITEIAVPGSDNALMLMELDRNRGIAVGEGAIWLPDMASSSVMKIDPARNEVVMTIPTDIFGSSGSIGVGEGAVWVITFDSHDKTLTRYNTQSGAVEAKIGLPQASKGVLVAFGSVWVTAANRSEIYRVDPRANQVASTIPIHAATHLIAADDIGSIWLGFDAEGLIQRIDGQTGQVLATIETGTSDMESDGDIAVGGGFVWMINRGTIVSRIDPVTNAVKGTFRPPVATSNGRRIRFGDGSLWLSGNGIYRMTPPQ